MRQFATRERLCVFVGKKMLPGGGILCSFTEKRLRELLLMKRHKGIFHGNSFEDREMIWHRFQLAQASNSEAN